MSNQGPLSQFIKEIHKKLDEEEARLKAEEESLTDEDRVFNKLKYPPRKKESVLMPFIRHITPSIIAQDIIGVQPMTGPIEEIFKMPVKYNPDTKEEE